MNASENGVGGKLWTVGVPGGGGEKRGSIYIPGRLSQQQGTPD